MAPVFKPKGNHLPVRAVADVREAEDKVHLSSQHINHAKWKQKATQLTTKIAHHPYLLLETLLLDRNPIEFYSSPFISDSSSLKSRRPRELVGLDPVILIAVHPLEEPVHLAQRSLKEPLSGLIPRQAGAQLLQHLPKLLQASSLESLEALFYPPPR